MMMAMSPDGMQLDQAEALPEYNDMLEQMVQPDGQEFMAFASPSVQDDPQRLGAQQPSASSVEVER